MKSPLHRKRDLRIALSVAAVCSVTSASAGLVWQSPLDGDGMATIGENATAFGSPTGTTDLSGNPNGAVLFNSATMDHFTIAPTIATFQECSVSVWIRPDEVVTSREDGIFGIGASGGGTSQYFTVMNRASGDGRFRSDLDDGALRRDVLSDAAPTAGEWIHLAVSFNSRADGSLEQRMYIDGVLQSDTQEIPAGTYSMTNTWIFGSERTTSRFFVGAMDDLRIYDNELVQSDIDLLVMSGPQFGASDDLDMDSLPDTWEVANGLSPDDNGLNPNNNGVPGDPNNGAAGDPDMDNLSNLTEFMQGTDPQNPDSDFDNLRDDVETNTGTYVDAGDTGTDPRNSDSDEDGLRDDYETVTGMFVSPTDTGSSPVTAMSDADANPDGWEVQFGLDPNDASDGILDGDMDMLNNEEEFAAGTDPTDEDSDDDTLLDGPEIDTTMTDPLDYDSDSDGLSDGVETNTMIFVNEDDTGTDPNNPNSDGDAVQDLAEILFGTDPNNPASVPSNLPQVLMIGGAGNPTTGADPAIFEFLGQRYDPANVTYLQASASDSDSDDGFDLLVLSSTPGSGDLRSKFQDSPVPLVNWEEAIADDGDGELQLTTTMTKPGGITEVEILDNTHPITEPFVDGPLTIFSTPASTSASSGTLGDGVVALVDIDGNIGLFIAEVGAELLGDGLSAGFPAEAAGRRVNLPFNDPTFDDLNVDGRTLIGRAFDWAVGLYDNNDPIRITEFVVDFDIDTATIQFTSVAGQNYIVDESTALEAWQPVAGTETIGAEGTTQIELDDFTVNFPAPSYLRVRETN